MTTINRSHNSLAFKAVDPIYLSNRLKEKGAKVVAYYAGSSHEALAGIEQNGEPLFIRYTLGIRTRLGKCLKSFRRTETTSNSEKTAEEAVNAIANRLNKGDVLLTEKKEIRIVI